MAVSTFARRYAEAVFDIAAARKEEDRWGDELARIAATLQDRVLDAVLGSPRVPFDVKQELVREALPGLSNLALNLVYLLVKKGKNYLAPAIAAEYRRLHDYYHGIEHAEVTSAFPLDEAEREALARRLGAVTGKTIMMETKTDPQIIGGLVVRIGDRLIDGSVRAKLENLKRTLLRAGGRVAG